jgi:hypothetical protein
MDQRSLWSDHPIEATPEGFDRLGRSLGRTGRALWVRVRSADRSVLAIGSSDDVRREWVTGPESVRDTHLWALGLDRALGPRRATRRPAALLFEARLAGVETRLCVLKCERRECYESAVVAHFGPLWDAFRAVCKASCTLEARAADLASFGAAVTVARELDVALPELEERSRRRFWW